MPSMPLTSIVELARLAEADIADFEARWRQLVPIYQPGDRVILFGEILEVLRYQQEEMPGYWLRGERPKALFVPLDLERALEPVAH